MDRPRILLVEDDEILSESMVTRLSLEGMEPIHVTTCQDAADKLGQRAFDLAICDIRLPDGSGEDVFRHILAARGLMPTVFVTAFSDVEQAVRLIKAGASDYITKPYETAEFVSRIKALLTQRESGRGPAPLQGESAAMDQLRAGLSHVLHTTMPIILAGPGGSGKRRAARHLHALAGATCPFVEVGGDDLASPHFLESLFGSDRPPASEGLAAQVGEGTLFITGLADTPLDAQQRLLRFVDQRRYRRIGATAEQTFAGRIVVSLPGPSAALVDSGRLSPDLLNCIGTIELDVPALANRPDDIEVLATSLLDEIAGEQGSAPPTLTPDAMRALRAHGWPGNVRELRNRLARATLFARDGQIESETLFPDDRLSQDADRHSLDAARREAERARIESALQAHDWRVLDTASYLGISRVTLWSKMRQLKIATKRRP